MTPGEKRKPGRPPHPAELQKVRYVVRLHKETRAWAERGAAAAGVPVSAWVADLVAAQARRMVQRGDPVLPDSYLDLTHNGHRKGEFAKASRQMTVYLSRQAAEDIEVILAANHYAARRQPTVIARVVASYYLEIG